MDATLTIILAKTFSGLCIAVMSVTLVALLIRYFADPFFPGFQLSWLIAHPSRIFSPTDEDVLISSSPTRQMRRRFQRNQLSAHNQVKVLAFVFTCMAASRLLIFLSVLLGCAIQGELPEFLSNFSTYWLHWDANRYIALAEQGYSASAEQGYSLTYFPLYPMFIRLIRPLFLGNTVLAATVLSNICLAIAGWLLYLVTFEQQGERAARRAVRFLMFCPLSIFFSLPYAESLFLALTLGAVFLARRRFFAAAVFAGILAASTRLLGLVIAVPIYLEMLKHVHSRGLWPRRKGREIMLIAGYTLMDASILLGFFAYLLLNWRVSGNPLQFLAYQQEHLHQTFGSIWNSLEYSVWYALQGNMPIWRWSLWIPQSVAIIAALALLLLTARRVDPGDGAFLWMYMFCALAPTWLLSGPRYLAAAYAFYPTLAMTTRKPAQDNAVTITFAALLVACSYLYAVTGTFL